LDTDDLHLITPELLKETVALFFQNCWIKQNKNSSRISQIMAQFLSFYNISILKLRFRL
jgi:hypothetical protein